MNDSLYPFSQGEPGVMNSVFTPTAFSQSLTFLAVNSDPLSLLIYSGTPLLVNKSNKVSHFLSCKYGKPVTIRESLKVLLEEIFIFFSFRYAPLFLDA